MTQTIGNLYPFVERIASQNVATLSFENNAYTDISSWREQARGKLLELLRYRPPTTQLAPEIVEIADCGDYIREKLYFSSAPGVRIPAYLLRPSKPDKPAPAIVALHDHGGFYSIGKEKLIALTGESAEVQAFRETYYSGRSYATELVRRGYVVIAIDAFYFGERRVDFDTIDPVIRQRMQSRISTLTEKTTAYHEHCSVFEEVVARHIFAAGATWLGVMSHDDRSSVDYLLSRPEVDPDRIGCLGLSMGGHRNNYLFATDPRIKAAVTVGWMTNWNDLLPNHVGSHSWAQFVPGLAGSFELSDVVSIGMPGSLLVLQCSRDELFTVDGMHRACEKIERIYTKAGLRDHFQSRFYDVPHQFNATMQEDAFAWLDRWLK
jgi:dienelactone hydrolase